MSWHPKEDDLNGYAHGLMEDAYRNRERPKCSREDFFDGYLAALRDIRARSMFKPGQFEANAETSDG